MNRLTTEQRAMIVKLMVEGMSIRAICRVTNHSKQTVLRFLVDMGEVCKQYHDLLVRNLKCRRIQCDEIWSFNYCKEKRVLDSKAAPVGAGSVWTWTGMCADTKLMIAYRAGLRDMENADEFMHDLDDRLARRVQLTTDGLQFYRPAVENAFGGEIDYAMLIKLYGELSELDGDEPVMTPICQTIQGDPDLAYISTSYVERQNLSLRMGLRRFTRLTNGHSKKFENHQHAVALFYFHYNFCRGHETLKGRTPAMAARVAKRAWRVGDVVRLLEKEEVRTGDRNSGHDRPST